MGPAFSRWRSAALSAQLLLATAWCGALWTIGYVVAPGLFAALPDRVLAGSLAGRFFAAVGWIGLVAGALIVVVSALRGRWRTRFAMLATAMWACSAASLFVFQPQVAQLRDAAGGRPVQGTELAAPFARWHAVSGGLYLLQSVLGLGLMLAWRRETVTAPQATSEDAASASSASSASAVSRMSSASR